MTGAADIARWLDDPTALLPGHGESERLRVPRILDIVRQLAARLPQVVPNVDHPASTGSLSALNIGTVVAQQLEPRPEALVAVEIGAAVLAAPWLPDDSARESALVRGLRVVDRLLPSSLDLGRDTGTWGAIAGAMGVATDRAPEQVAEIAFCAASLALAPVTVTQADTGYCALRVGHASASALFAVSLVDSGFVGDPQAIDELRERLGIDHESAPDRHRGAIAPVALESMEEAVR